MGWGGTHGLMKGALEKGVARNTGTDSTLQIYQAAIEGTREKKQEKERENQQL